jgi:hypothetical protein
MFFRTIFPLVAVSYLSSNENDKEERPVPIHRCPEQARKSASKTNLEKGKKIF